MVSLIFLVVVGCYVLCARVQANMDKIFLANKQNFTYTLGMNEMGDMSHEEFKAAKLGYKAVDVRLRFSIDQSLCWAAD